MAIGTANVYATIRRLIPGASNSSKGTVTYPDTLLEDALDLALVWHSRFFPRRALYIGTGDGSNCIFAVPSDYMRSGRVEYEYGGTPPAYLSETEWEIHLGTSDYEIVFDDAPGSADLFGFHYIGRWTAENAKSTDEKPLAVLASAMICLRQAAKTADTVDPTLQADVTDYKGRSYEWIRLKNEFIRLYAGLYGLNAKTVEEGAPPLAFRVGTVPVHERFDRVWWKNSEDG